MTMTPPLDELLEAARAASRSAYCPYSHFHVGAAVWAGGLAVLRRHTRTIQIVGAIALIVLGLLMLTGLWGSFIAWLQGRIAGVGTVL